MMLLGHDPRSIANVMIEFALEDGLHLPNVSVQKLLYFAHASYLVRNRRPLVSSLFEAWEYGPVCRPVYDALKQYGRASVPKKIEQVDIFTGEIEEFEFSGDRRTRFHIEGIMMNLGHLSPGQLIDLSHAKDGAWHAVWNKSKTGATIGNTIDDKLTEERFAFLKMPINTPTRGDPDEATPIAGD